MLKLPGRCTAIVLATVVSISSAQQAGSPDLKAPLDQKVLLGQTRRAYYLPLERGVKGFACTVAFNWPEVLERASKRKIPAREPTLVALESATSIVTDDILKGATVKADFPHGAPSPGSPVASRQKILESLVTASLAGWNTFLSNRFFPLEGTLYRFEAVATGYRLTLEGGIFFSILDLDPQFRVTHGESHLNGTTTEFTPTFDASSHGWLITSLKTVTIQPMSGTAETKAEGASSSADNNSTGNGGEGESASFTYSYQFAGDVLIPKRVTVQYADGPETPYELKDCVLSRTIQKTAEEKAAPGTDH